MSGVILPVVYDCNILFQALITNRGPSYRCMELAEDGDVQLCISHYLFEEIRDLSVRPILRDKFQLETSRVEAFLDDVESYSTLINEIPDQYQHPIDPKDSHYVNLALAAEARLIVSRDNHLLNLMDASRPESLEFQQRFPRLSIMVPPAFLVEVERLARSEQST